MKILLRFTLMIILFVCSTKLSAQDTLIMTNGTFISAKILEVSTEEVKYKRFDNLDGPTFIAKTSEINVIKYKGGVMDLLNKPKTPVAVAPVDPNPSIFRRGAGYSEENNYRRMREREMQDRIMRVSDSQINFHVKKARMARGLQNVGFVAIPALAFTIGYSVYAIIRNNNNNNGAAGFRSVDYTPGIATGVVAVAAFATSITFSVVRKNHNNAAIKIYNEKY